MVSRERWILTPFELQSRAGARDEEPLKRVTPWTSLLRALSHPDTLHTAVRHSLSQSHHFEHRSRRIFTSQDIRFMFYSAPQPLAPEVEVEAAGAAIAVAHTT